MKNFFVKLGNIFSILLVIIVIFGAGFWVGKHNRANAVEAPHTEKPGFDLKLPGETEKATVTVDEVEAKILEIGELSTCEGEYTVTRGKDFQRNWLDNIPVLLTKNRIDLTCSGIVKAGYNLKDIGIQIDESSKTIYVSLPEVQINSNQLLWDDSMVCNEKNNILNPIEFDQYQELFSEIQ